MRNHLRALRDRGHQGTASEEAEAMYDELLDLIDRHAPRST